MRYQTADRVRHAAAELGYRKAYNDLMAIGFVQKVTAAGLGVPGDVSVIGFDNIVDATLVEPQLTTIAAPQVRLGSAAVARVLKSSRLARTVRRGRRGWSFVPALVRNARTRRVGASPGTIRVMNQAAAERAGDGAVTLFLCGDVMLGRGVDQILPHPGDPTLRERSVHDARTYVALAARVNGSIPQPVDWSWPWGDALELLAQVDCDARIINLETSITTSSDFDLGKGVHYRMHPANVPAVGIVRPDVCVLANNHVLDFGRRGLLETLDVLAASRTPVAGAGRSLDAAEAPAFVPIPRSGGRVVVFAFGTPSGGIPHGWAAAVNEPGVNLIASLTDVAADELCRRAEEVRQPGDIVVVSAHWGTNWGYEVEADHVRFAHRLIDGGVDVVHGHSSHHPRPIEVYSGKLILYGCGDLIDDYEGITGHERYRDDLRLLYLPRLDPASGQLKELRLAPLQARQLRLHRASERDAEWLRAVLDDVSRTFGSRIDRGAGEFLTLAIAPLLR